MSTKTPRNEARLSMAAENYLLSIYQLQEQGVRVTSTQLAEQLIDHYLVLLDSALARPDSSLRELDLMSGADREWLREMTHGPAFDTAPATIVDLVEAQAARTPEATAVVYEGRHYSYRELNEYANQVAHWLIAHEIGTEDRVADSVLAETVFPVRIRDRVIGRSRQGDR